MNPESKTLLDQSPELLVLLLSLSLALNRKLYVMWRLSNNALLRAKEKHIGDLRRNLPKRGQL